MSSTCSPHCECKPGSAANRGEKPETEKPYDVTGGIIAYESGDLDTEEVLVLFSHLVKSGLAWSLQGSYGRAAASLIESGYIEARTGRILRSLDE